MEISSKSLRKVGTSPINRALLIPGGKSNGTDIPGEKVSKSWVYLAKFSSSSKILGNTSSVAIGNFSEIHTRMFGRIEISPVWQNGVTRSTVLWRSGLAQGS